MTPVDQMPDTWRGPNYIELDCEPGSPRPGDLLPGVLEGTGLKLDAEHPNSTFFGNWTWYIPLDQLDVYRKVKPILKQRIEALYHRGVIRYGSW